MLAKSCLLIFLMTIVTKSALSQSSNHFYTLVSCDTEVEITKTLPRGCVIDSKLDFGMGACPTYRLKCPQEMSKETKGIVSRSVGKSSNALQEDPIVQGIVVKEIK
ncbi:hypothetical protein Ciccas_012570 [Cichlidogyrus casuarinus]|uniref:Uncharacterized protein n=1 Tax=Cichlidogyrus casuarinus TaxID=1844966 RepID=A0ABD2PP82_9PLAT